MPFVLRKGGTTDQFLNDSAKYGPLEDAYPYQDRERAESEVYPGDEIVEVRLVVIEPQEGSSPVPRP